MASNGHFNIRFCTVTVNIYRLLKRNYGIGDQSFRTVTVDIYQSKQKYITNKLLSFRTVSVDIYQECYKELTGMDKMFSYSIC